MNDCCARLVHEFEPNQPRMGVFQELHQCPNCREWLRVEFEGIPAMGGDDVFAVIAAEPVNRSR